MKTISIYEDPNSYFLPEFKGSFFEPLKIKKSGPIYYLYGLCAVLSLPFKRAFWGKWKQEIKDCDRVILFDHGYRLGMEKYIKRINPKCKVFMFCWNHVDAAHDVSRKYSEKENIFSSDLGDCNNYGYTFAPVCYAKSLSRSYKNCGNKLFFCGNNKGRKDLVQIFADKISLAGVECDLLFPKDKSQYLGYYDYLDKLDSYDLLLDVNQKGQQGFSLRVLESIYLSKKLLTTNTIIKNFDFYNPNNIFIMDEDPNKLDVNAVKEFLELPYEQVPKEILDEYDYKNWVNFFN